MRPVNLSGYPAAILHLDADAFFTSVEQALHPSLRGRPVVTGQERGIIACASYEAKALGIQRGIPLFEARRACPGLVILPSDYETYSLYSQRMFEIMRRFTPAVEEYSIDEAFADLSGLRRLYRCPYADIARRMQETIRDELGITVSAGLSLSKTLAKRCSKFRKPAGLTAVPGRFVHILLQHTPMDAVWGFGPNTVNLLHKHGLRTAADFVQRPRDWADRLLKKPGRELWDELRGTSVWPVSTAPQPPQASIMKSKTFTPPSTDPDLVYAKLVRNVEAAFAKARRHHRCPRALAVVLRRQDFRHDGIEARLSRATPFTAEVLPLVRHLFDRCFRAGTPYRSTMVVLGALQDSRSEQLDLFDDRLHIESLRRLTEAVDTVNARYGQDTVRAAVSLFLDRHPADPRQARPSRQADLLPGESERRRLALPRLDIPV